MCICCVVTLCQRFCRELPSASLIGGPALSDCISGPAGTQHGLNTQERWDGIGEGSVGSEEGQKMEKKVRKESVIRSRQCRGCRKEEERKERDQ